MVQGQLLRQGMQGGSLLWHDPARLPPHDEIRGAHPVNLLKDHLPAVALNQLRQRLNLHQNELHSS